MAGSSFFPEYRGLCIDKEPSSDSLVGVRSENRFTDLYLLASGIAVVKLTAGQVTQNTIKWPAVQILFLKRIEAKG